MYSVLVIINQLFSALRGPSGDTASPFSAHLPALWGSAEVARAASLCYFGNRDDWGALCNGIEFLAGGKETAMCECDSLFWSLCQHQDPFSIVACVGE